MSEPNANYDALPLIEALLNGEIDDAGFARLETILRDDADARRLYRSHANLHAALPGIVGKSPRLSINITDAEDEALEPHEMPHDQLMSLLAQVEEHGEDLDPMVLAANRFKTTTGKTRTKHQYVSALTYVIEHTFTPKRIAMLATAAALLMGMVLAIVLLSGPDNSHQIAEAPDQPVPNDNPPNVLAPIVATLTATHNAAWSHQSAEGASAPGSKLRAGQRLTLTHGFAEITTSRGAVAILEAPTTIELIDNDNALRLHAGKLVGRCESRASKGFTVETATSRVVDLGTEFAVSVNDAGEHEVHVFEGEVELRGKDSQDAAPRRLVARQAVRYREPAEAVAIEPDIEAFAASADGRDAYARAVLWEKPIAYYRFEGTGESRLSDSSGHANHAKAVGTLTAPIKGATEPLGNAIAFGGQSTVQLPKLLEAGDGLYDQFTISMLIKVNRISSALEGSDSNVVGILNTSASLGQRVVKEGEINLKINHEHRVVLGVHKITGPIAPWEPNNWHGLYSSNPLDKQWHHLAFTFDRDAGVMRMFLDGEPVQELVESLATPADLRNIILASNGEFQVDELAIFGRALSEESIRSHYEHSRLSDPAAPEDDKHDQFTSPSVSGDFNSLN